MRSVVGVGSRPFTPWMLGAFLGMVTSAVNPARAQDTQPADFGSAADLDGSTEEAQMHYRLAERYYETGRFPQAAAEFRAAYELTQLPPLLYNMFLAYREAGEIADAISSLERYADEVGDEEISRVARVRADNLRRFLPPPPEPEPASDGAEPPAPLAVDPVSSPPPPEPEPSEDLSWVPWVVAGGGALIALSAIAPGVLAISDAEQLDRLCATGRCEGDYMAVQDRGYARALAADLLLGAGLTVAVSGVIAGVILLMTQGEPDGGAVACTPSGCRFEGGVEW